MKMKTSKKIAIFITILLLEFIILAQCQQIAIHKNIVL